MVCENERSKIRFMDAHIDGKKIFFSARDMNGLFRYEIGKTEAVFLGHFNNEIIWQKDIHRQVISAGDFLYFIPYKGTGVSIYNKRTQGLSFVKMEELISVSRAFQSGEKIYMIPSDMNMPFIIYHTDSNDYETAEVLWKNICFRFSNRESFVWGLYSSCLLENKLFIKGEEGTILSADLGNGRIDTYKLPVKYKIRNMFYDKNVFYFLISDQCKIVKWDWQTNRCHEYRIDNMTDMSWHPYMCMLRWGEHLLVLPDQRDEILELDEKEDKWHKKEKYIPKDFCREKKTGSLFLGYQLIEDKLLLFPWMGNGMVILTKEGSELQEIYYPDGLLQTIQSQFIKEQLAQGNILYENSDEGISLKQVLSAIADVPKVPIADREDIGAQIWDACHPFR